MSATLQETPESLFRLVEPELRKYLELLRRPKLPRLELHPGQRQIASEAKRFNVVACGRRFGKSLLGADRAIETLEAGYPVGWFSPTYKMLEEAWREIKNATAVLKPKVSEQEHRMDFSGTIRPAGSRIFPTLDMWSLDSPDTARGRKYKRAIVDEAAMVASLGNAWQKVIRPMLTGGRLRPDPKTGELVRKGGRCRYEPKSKAFQDWLALYGKNYPREVDDARAAS